MTTMMVQRAPFAWTHGNTKVIIDWFHWNVGIYSETAASNGMFVQIKDFDSKPIIILYMVFILFKMDSRMSSSIEMLSDM